jgi:hypothetical protein
MTTKCGKCGKIIENIKVTISHTEKVGKVRKIYKLEDIRFCGDCFKKNLNNNLKDEDELLFGP